MRRTRSGCCARAASGHNRRAADKRDELAPPHPLAWSLSEGDHSLIPFVRLAPTTSGSPPVLVFKGLLMFRSSVRSH